MGQLRREFIRKNLDPEVADPSTQYTAPIVVPIESPGTMNPDCNDSQVTFHHDAEAWDLGSSNERIGMVNYANDDWGGAEYPTAPPCKDDDPEPVGSLHWPADVSQLLDGYVCGTGSTGGYRAGWYDGDRFTCTANSGPSYTTENSWNNRGPVQEFWDTGIVWLGDVLGVANGTKYAFASVWETSRTITALGPTISFNPPWPVHRRIQSGYVPLIYPYGDPIYERVKIYEVPDGDSEWIDTGLTIEGVATLQSDQVHSFHNLKGIPRDSGSFYVYSEDTNSSVNGIWLFDGGITKVADLVDTLVGCPSVDTEGNLWWIDQTDGDPQTGTPHGTLRCSNGGSVAVDPNNGWEFYGAQCFAPKAGIVTAARETSFGTFGDYYHATAVGGGINLEVTDCSTATTFVSFPAPSDGEAWRTAGNAISYLGGSFTDATMDTYEPFATLYLEYPSTMQVWVQMEVDAEGFGESDWFPQPSLFWNRMEPILDEDTGLIADFAPRENYYGRDYMGRTPDEAWDPRLVPVQPYYTSNEFHTQDLRRDVEDTPIHPNATGFDDSGVQKAVLSDLYTERIIIEEPGWWQLTAKVRSSRLAGRVTIRGFYVIQAEENDAVTWTPPKLLVNDQGDAINYNDIILGGGGPYAKQPTFEGVQGEDWY